MKGGGQFFGIYVCLPCTRSPSGCVGAGGDLPILFHMTVGRSPSPPAQPRPGNRRLRWCCHNVGSRSAGCTSCRGSQGWGLWLGDEGKWAVAIYHVCVPCTRSPSGCDGAGGDYCSSPYDSGQVTTSASSAAVACLLPKSFIWPAHHAVLHCTSGSQRWGLWRAMNTGGCAWCIGMCTWVQQAVVTVQVVALLSTPIWRAGHHLCLHSRFGHIVANIGF
jgi:hypothetical protein